MSLGAHCCRGRDAHNLGVWLAGKYSVLTQCLQQFDQCDAIIFYQIRDSRRLHIPGMGKEAIVWQCRLGI